MPARKITDTWLRAKSFGKRETRSEPGGLIARKGPAGVSFYLQYTLDGKLKWVHLGVYGDEGLTLAEARREAAAQRVQAAQARAGRAIDPANERRASKKAAARMERLVDPSVRAFASVFVARYAKVKRKTWAEADRILKRDVLPIVGEIKLAEIERKHVVALLDRKVDSGYPKQAGEVLKIVRKMLAFAVERGEIQINPATGIKPPEKSPPRRRVLVTQKADEIGGLFRALAASAMHPGMKLAIEFQTLTAQRPGAVRGARWAEIDRKRRTWTIPPERMKRMKASPWSDLPNVVPLSVEALAVIECAGALSGESPYLFPGRDPEKPWSDTAIDHELHRETMLAMLKERGVERFNLHDLRRTATTILASLGTMPHIVDKLLGHVPEGVTAEVYDVYEYLTEKRSALEALGARVAKMKRRRPIKGADLPFKQARRGR